MQNMMPGTSAGPNRLSQDFIEAIEQDGFIEVGSFYLDQAGLMACRLGQTSHVDKPFALYAFVAYEDGGTVLRIGESQDRPVRKRIMEYPRYINDARNSALGKTGYFAGGTKPWERDRWFSYLAAFGSGLIFVRHSGWGTNPEEIRRVLHEIQNRLIAKYAPPCCNDSVGSRPLREAWEALNGKAVKHYKRPRPPATGLL